MTMYLRKLKISHKIVAIIIIAIIIISSFAFLNIKTGSDQSAALESIFNENVIPLDNLRKIQLTFREIEYYMAAVQADIVAAAGASSHLKKSLSTIDTLWSDNMDSIELQELPDNTKVIIVEFENNYKDFKREVADNLQKAYSAI